MPNVKADIEYLANIPLYEVEKPYLALLPPSEGYDPDEHRTDNLEYETAHGMSITDIRGSDEFKLEKCGFQVMKHTSNIKSVSSIEDIEAYKRETEKLLTKQLGATHVHCYDVKVGHLNVTGGQLLMIF